MATEKSNTKNRFVGGYFPPHIKAELKRIAAAQRRTVPMLLLCLFEEYIEQDKAKETTSA